MQAGGRCIQVKLPTLNTPSPKPLKALERGMLSMLAEMHAEKASPCSMRTHALALMQPPGDIHVRVGGHAAIRLSCISTTLLMG